MFDFYSVYIVWKKSFLPLFLLDGSFYGAWHKASQGFTSAYLKEWLKLPVEKDELRYETLLKLFLK